MGNFFYYGQQDTIRRLNELAGRGAVVSSYAPAVGMSPLGGPNGYMNPAWLDPNISLGTMKPISIGLTSKYGYDFVVGGAGATRWLLIASMNSDGSNTNANLYIRGVFNSAWTAATSTPFSIFMGVRGGFYVDWHIEGAILSQSRIMVCRRANGVHDVYAFFDAGAFATISFDMTGHETTTYATPVETTATPTGTMVFDSATSPANPIHIAPRWKGVTGRLAGSRATAFSDTIFTGENGNLASGGHSFLAGGTILGTVTPLEVLRLGVSGVSGTAFHGHFGFLTNPGNVPYTPGYKLDLKAYDTGSGNWTNPLLSVNGDGRVSILVLKVGSTDTVLTRHNISRPVGQGSEILYVGQDGAANPSVAVIVADGAGGWNTAGNVFYVGKNSSTNRSVSAAGTVNTMGNDYAEYIHKSATCASVLAGQIVGITADNNVTDQWADAVMFSIKSTDPSFVGGDSWAVDAGPRPSPQAGAAPVQPVRREDVVAQQAVPDTDQLEFEEAVTEPGDTDDEWAAKQAAYAAALAAHNIAVLQDVEAMATFDAALEVERQKVDRIAIAGRVPVNVLGAQPGDYIVPVQDGAGIKGIPIRKADLTHSQYLDAVGRVISIEPDGRAYVMVKVV
ncbi:hypothetical protein [Janthinobacterium sp. BJB426]|uniref:hypothetical protein n=1 Tax=Janthinobacterium sp. BJB426 TaxID=2048010 RepID=UPI0013054202|nr:hypothetical protein [Janthinobacterium sp. BJB426]